MTTLYLLTWQNSVTKTTHKLLIAAYIEAAQQDIWDGAIWFKLRACILVYCLLKTVKISLFYFHLSTFVSLQTILFEYIKRTSQTFGLFFKCCSLKIFSNINKHIIGYTCSFIYCLFILVLLHFCSICSQWCMLWTGFLTAPIVYLLLLSSHSVEEFVCMYRHCNDQPKCRCA